LFSQFRRGTFISNFDNRILNLNDNCLLTSITWTMTLKGNQQINNKKTQFWYHQIITWERLKQTYHSGIYSVTHFLWLKWSTI
jgi:hypothetical protein